MKASDYILIEAVGKVEYFKSVRHYLSLGYVLVGELQIERDGIRAATYIREMIKPL